MIIIIIILQGKVGTVGNVHVVVFWEGWLVGWLGGREGKGGTRFTIFASLNYFTGKKFAGDCRRFLARWVKLSAKYYHIITTFIIIMMVYITVFYCFYYVGLLERSRIHKLEHKAPTLPLSLTFLSTGRKEREGRGKLKRLESREWGRETTRNSPRTNERWNFLMKEEGYGGEDMRRRCCWIKLMRGTNERRKEWRRCDWLCQGSLRQHSIVPTFQQHLPSFLSPSLLLLLNPYAKLGSVSEGDCWLWDGVGGRR